MYFSKFSQDEMYWYCDKKLRNKDEIVAECSRQGYLVDVFVPFVSAAMEVSREEYLEIMHEDL